MNKLITRQTGVKQEVFDYSNKIKVFKRRLAQWILKHKVFSKEKMAEYAYKNTTFYKHLYGRIVKRGERVKNISFKNLPLVMKKTVNDYLPFDLLSRKLEKKVFKYGETTGSTGSPTPSFYTRQEFYGSVLLSKITPYSMLFEKILKENRNAVCGLACGFTIAGLSFQQILDEKGFLTINVDSRTTISPPHRVARLLSRFKPAVIVAGETDFLAWMKVLKEQYPREYDDVVKNVKVLISTAELCSKSRSRQIEAEFNITHVDTYACVEGYFSVPCPCGEKHILPIYETEVLSEDLSDSKEFGTGRFAFTNLLRKSTPFVRYLLDDLVTITPSNCRYGFSKSIKPHGRYELTVSILGKRFGTEHFENLLFEHFLFGEYQIIIEADRIVIKAEDYSGKLVPVQKIKDNFYQAFGLKTELEIVRYGAIRDYRKIRQSKPLLRLIDKRDSSEQKIPEYL